MSLVYLTGICASRDDCLLLERASAYLIRRGNAVVCPVLQQVALERYLKRTWDYWRERCLILLHLCDTICVLQNDGYEQSFTVQAELAAAIAYGLHVEYLSVEFLNISFPEVGT